MTRKGITIELRDARFDNEIVECGSVTTGTEDADVSQKSGLNQEVPDFGVRTKREYWHPGAIN
jgi:hypothetical protein